MIVFNTHDSSRFRFLLLLSISVTNSYIYYDSFRLWFTWYDNPFFIIRYTNLIAIGNTYNTIRRLCIEIWKFQSSYSAKYTEQCSSTWISVPRRNTLSLFSLECFVRGHSFITKEVFAGHYLFSCTKSIKYTFSARKFDDTILRLVRDFLTKLK